MEPFRKKTTASIFMNWNSFDREFDLSRRLLFSLRSFYLQVHFLSKKKSRNYRKEDEKVAHCCSLLDQIESWKEHKLTFSPLSQTFPICLRLTVSNALEKVPLPPAWAETVCLDFPSNFNVCVSLTRTVLCFVWINTPKHYWSRCPRIEEFGSWKPFEAARELFLGSLKDCSTRQSRFRHWDRKYARTERGERKSLSWFSLWQRWAHKK